MNDTSLVIASNEVVTFVEKIDIFYDGTHLHTSCTFMLTTVHWRPTSLDLHHYCISQSTLDSC